jgi:hypothetical protein
VHQAPGPCSGASACCAGVTLSTPPRSPTVCPRYEGARWNFTFAVLGDGVQSVFTCNLFLIFLFYFFLKFTMWLQTREDARNT